MPDITANQTDETSDFQSGSQSPFDISLLEGTNIHPETLLATDYLNHFNEMAMMIEMLPMMPDALEDIAAWEPLSYQDHFRHSGLRDADMAIIAYRHAPDQVRQAFDETIVRLNECVVESIADAHKMVEISNQEILAFKASEVAARILSVISEAASIINGGAAQVEETDDTQDAINALFD